MTPSLLYALAGAGLVAIGLYGLLLRRHLLWKVLALNIQLNGAFLMLVGAPARASGIPADPVPQAMVLTGIVVAVSATAFALALLRRLHAITGETTFSRTEREGE
jgi:multicomponent Na+:H+ antiporter subunit C